MFDKIKKLFKKEGSGSMPTEKKDLKEKVENVEETNIEEKENLEASETNVETQSEEVETKSEDTVVEEPKAEETKVEEEKVETKSDDFQKDLSSLKQEFEGKLTETKEEFEKKLSEKDKTIEAQNKKIEELEKLMPNDGVRKGLTEEETREPDDLKRSNVASGFWGN